MTLQFNTDVPVEVAEATLHDRAVVIPEGYTRAGIVMTPTDVFLIATGDGLPAMGFIEYEGVAAWRRLFSPKEPLA